MTPMWSSSRVISKRTGWPVRIVRSAAMGSMHTRIFPPNPPPISVGTIRTRDSAIPSASATSARASKGDWVVVQMVTLPFAPASARQACGSM